MMHDTDFKSGYPTSPFTNLKPRNLGVGEICVVLECRTTDFEAPKLWKGRSGTFSVYFVGLYPMYDDFVSLGDFPVSLINNNPFS